MPYNPKASLHALVSDRTSSSHTSCIVRLTYCFPVLHAHLSTRKHVVPDLSSLFSLALICHSSLPLALYSPPAAIQLVPFGRSGGHGQVTSPLIGTFMPHHALVWVAKGRDLFVDYMFLPRFKGWKKFSLPPNPCLF
jgi:hypothetical protein